MAEHELAPGVDEVVTDRKQTHIGTMRTDIRIQFDTGFEHTGEIDGDAHFFDDFMGYGSVSNDVRARDVAKAAADRTHGVALQWRVLQRDAWSGVSRIGEVTFNWPGAVLRLLREPHKFASFDVVFIERPGETLYEAHKRDMTAAGLRCGSVDPADMGVRIAEVRDLVWKVDDAGQRTLDDWLVSASAP